MASSTPRLQESIGKVHLTGSSTVNRAQTGHDVFAVELEKTFLIRAGSVKNKVTETQIDVRLDLFHMLVGIRGYDPALCRAFNGERVRKLLHFDRVLDRYFLFRRKRKRSPIFRIFQCSLTIGVVGN